MPFGTRFTIHQFVVKFSIRKKLELSGTMFIIRNVARYSTRKNISLVPYLLPKFLIKKTSAFWYHFYYLIRDMILNYKKLKQFGTALIIQNVVTFSINKKLKLLDTIFIIQKFVKIFNHIKLKLCGTILII